MQLGGVRLGYLFRALRFSVRPLTAGLLGTLLSIGSASLVRADEPSLSLVEAVVDPNVWPAGQYALSDGAISLSLNDGTYKLQHGWSRPPSTIDASGFDMTLTVAGQVTSNCQSLSAGTQVSGSAFEFSPNPAGVEVNLTPPSNCDLKAGASNSASATIHVKPLGTFADGQTVELRVNAYFGPGVTYRYKASGDATSGSTTTGGQAGPAGPGDDGKLAGTLDCDGASIVISALPSLNCHIILTSWRRNTATPVEVIFPNELDTFGNHENGIQLQGRGSEDIFNWDAPHSWGLFVFACPGQQGTGANCYGSATTPGPAAVDILVRQGEDILPLTLTLTAVGQTQPNGFTRSSNGVTGFVLEPDTDRPGLDYRSFDVTVDDPQVCLDACAAENMCVAFTHVRPGIQGPNARCWLKSEVPTGGPSQCCVSGVRQ